MKNIQLLPISRATASHQLFSVSHGVWLSFRFSLRDWDSEHLLAQRGMVVTYETVGQRYLKCGQTSAHERCHRRPRCGAAVLQKIREACSVREALSMLLS
jgi:transposase-like protein